MTRRDGEDDDERPQQNGGRRMASARQLREMLRENGIELESDAQPARAAAKVEPTIDRERIRAILADVGIGDDELAWMVPSCPGESYAIKYAARCRKENDARG